MTDRPHERAELARLGRLVTVMAAVATVLVLYVVQAALPAAAFALPGVSRSKVKSLMPEGWSFFTANPRATPTIPYGLGRDGQWHSLGAGVMSEPDDLFGLNRTQRAQGTEIALVLDGVPSTSWSSCSISPQTCLSELRLQGTLRNSAVHKTLCGDVGFVRQEVLPWAWRSGSKSTTMPSQVLRVAVTC